MKPDIHLNIHVSLKRNEQFDQIRADLAAFRRRVYEVETVESVRTLQLCLNIVQDLDG